MLDDDPTTATSQPHCARYLQGLGDVFKCVLGGRWTSRLMWWSATGPGRFWVCREHQGCGDLPSCWLAACVGPERSVVAVVRASVVFVLLSVFTDYISTDSQSQRATCWQVAVEIAEAHHQTDHSSVIVVWTLLKYHASVDQLNTKKYVNGKNEQCLSPVPVQTQRLTYF